MNHIYKTVYNPRLGLWQAVAENARGRSKSRRGAARMLAGLLALAATQALAADYDIDGGSTVTVTPSVPQAWSTSDQLRVGPSSSGTLLIEQGGSVISAGGHIGRAAGSTGTVIVDGSGSSWTTNGTLNIGDNGTGTLIIRNGASFTSANISDIYIGGATGSAVTVTGNGSSLNHPHYLLVDSTGRLNIQNGGQASVTEIDGNGTVSVSGSGSLLNADVFNSGTLNILDGASVNLLDITMRQVTVDGPGSTLTINTPLVATTVEIYGTLNIRNGGTVNLPEVWVGPLLNSSGTIEITGSGSSLSSTNLLIGRLGGSGTLNIRNGASVSSGSSDLGLHAGSNGTVTVDGSGSLWDTALLNVGSAGNGTLNILNGAQVQSDIVAISSSAGGASTVTVDGNGLMHAGQLSVGGAGNDTLSILNGAQVHSNSVRLGEEAGGTGTLNLLGTASARGVLQTGLLTRVNGTANVNWHGGILRATGTEANYLRNFSAAGISVGSVGAWFDTNGYNVGFSTAGLLTGSGSFTKLGAGTLSIAGSNSYGGNTTVSAGTLQFDTYDQSNGQTLTLGVTSTSSHAQLAVTGTASFNADASLAVDAASANTLAVGQTLSSVISAGTLNASTFNVSDNSALFNFEAVLNGNAVDLAVSQGLSVQDAAASAGLGTSAQGAAQVLNTLLNSAPGGDMGTVVTALGSLGSARDVGRAVAQTLPLVSGVAALQGVLGTFNRVLENRQDSNSATLPSALTYASLGGAGDLPAGPASSSGQAWARTFGARADQADHQGSAGFDAGTWGLALGADTPWGNEQRLGLAYAYARTQVSGHTDLSGAAQNAGIDTHLLALYGSRELARGLALSWQADLGLSQHKSARAVNFGGLARTASAAYDSYSAHAGLALARRMPLDADTTLVPGLSADYTWLHSRAYAESGADALNLQVGAQSTDALVLGADLKFAHRLTSLSDLSGYAGLGYDAINQRNPLVAAYAGAPTQQFSTSAADPSPWIARAGLAYSRSLANGTDVSLHYDVQTRGPLLNQSASVKATWVF